MIKLWHDDVRPAPEGWEWARTNSEAKKLLETGNVVEVSLDHDLGYDGPPPGECPDCGGLGEQYTSAYNSYTCMTCDGDGVIGNDVLYVAGTSQDDGYCLVEWMLETGNVPDKITIHSWNPDGARRMANALRDAGHSVTVAPFSLT